MPESLCVVAHTRSAIANRVSAEAAPMALRIDISFWACPISMAFILFSGAIQPRNGQSLSLSAGVIYEAAILRAEDAMKQTPRPRVFLKTALGARGRGVDAASALLS